MSDTSTKKDEEKKGAGVPSWMTGTAKVGSGVGSGGSSAAGSGLTRFLALLGAPKAIVAMTVAGGMAVGIGIASSISEPEQPSLASRFNKEKIRTEGGSNLPGSEVRGDSALRMAQNANSGFFADPNAAAQAPKVDEAGGASDAPADQAGAAPAGEAKAGGEQAGVGEQMAAALGAQQTSKAGNKFGKLSSAMGGGGGRSMMAGGSGLSGGIGGSFKQNLTNSRGGELRALAGANRAQVTRGKLSSSNLGKSALKGANAKRLDGMNRAMGNMGTSNADATAAGHSRQWDAAAPTGSGISGAGASGTSGGGQFSGDEGVGGGGPLDTNTGGGTSANDVADVGNTKNQTQYQDQLMMAQGMLLLAAAIIAVVGILCFTRNAALASPEPFSKVVAAGLTVAMKIAIGVAIGLAVAAAAIGASISSKYGQGDQGKIIAMGGTITAATGIAALLIPQMPAWILVLGGIIGMAAPLMGGAGGKTSNRSDISANGNDSGVAEANHKLGKNRVR